MVTLPNQKTLSKQDTSPWLFREPTIEDGQAIHHLIANSPPLDTNSAYCNFLQCIHFSSTCILAEDDRGTQGFISAYQKPSEPQTLFIWQVSVSVEARGQGLAFQMLKALINRLPDISALETTITKTNDASWSLFKKVDSELGSQGKVSIFIEREKDFKGTHDTEYLFRIPLSE